MTDLNIFPIEVNNHYVDGQKVTLDTRIHNAAMSAIGYWLELDGMLISGGKSSIMGVNFGIP